MRKALITALGLILCGAMVTVPGDARAQTSHRQPTAATTRPPADLEWTLVREDQREVHDWHLLRMWTDVLMLPDLGWKVPLMSSYEGHDESPPFTFGVDQETLTLRWLGEEDERGLLWIQWRTYPFPGSGALTWGGDLVLAANGHVLVREVGHLFGKSGGQFFQDCEIGFEKGDARAGQHALVRVMRQRTSEHAEENAPLAGQHRLRHYVIEQRTHYTFDLSARYRKGFIQRHHSTLDLSALPLFDTTAFDGRAFTLDEVAAFLVTLMKTEFHKRFDFHGPSPQNSSTDEEREDMKSALLKLNPGLEEHPTMRTRVKIPASSDMPILHRDTPGNGLMLFERAECIKAE